ncbi:MAG: DUF512 domain-containing protein [Lachnospiraceae bacterium]|nr:DUF512 domain-containing protein [Lachnospiraceae bacterium]
MKTRNPSKVHRIAKVLPGSIAEEMGVEPGDSVISVNGKEIADIFDYRYLMQDEYVEIGIMDEKGEEYLLEVEKEENEDFGVEFENALMDEYRSCRNHCIFCFIDQMPPGMRPTLYFKDDDMRLSFLQGNYVTLTNLSDEDIRRICLFHMEPVNISIQTMDPELRVRMLRNRFAGEALSKMKDLKDAGIHMNGQIVLCKGINDGSELVKTLDMAEAYFPELQSISVVPVGLTKYRKDLYPLEPFTKEDAGNVIDLIERYQDTFMERYGQHCVYASDEWYLTAGRVLPPAERYDGYPQLENGVGMLRLLSDEIDETLAGIRNRKVRPHRLLALCGTAAFPYMRRFMERITERFPGVLMDVLAIRNDFFGESITVSGLVTGGDLISQVRSHLAQKPEGSAYEAILIPCEMLRAGETVFLDDVSVRDVEEAFGLPVIAVMPGGASFVNAVLAGAQKDRNVLKNGRGRKRQNYEQTDRSDRGKTERR